MLEATQKIFFFESFRLIALRDLAERVRAAVKRRLRSKPPTGWSRAFAACPFQAARSLSVGPLSALQVLFADARPAL